MRTEQHHHKGAASASGFLVSVMSPADSLRTATDSSDQNVKVTTMLDKQNINNTFDACENDPSVVGPDVAVASTITAAKCKLGVIADFSSTMPDFKVFSNVELKSSLNSRLPLPSKLLRYKSMSAASGETSCYSGAVVSLTKPFKILAASKEFLQAVKLASDQIVGRSIHVLLAPQSDAEAVSTAIKSAAQLRPTSLRMFLHSSDGRDLDVTASFSPYRGPSDDAPRGCLLQIECIHDAESEPAALPVFLLDDFGTRGADGCAGERQLRLLREARRATGLDNERERLRQLARSAWKRAASTY